MSKRDLQAAFEEYDAADTEIKRLEQAIAIEFTKRIRSHAHWNEIRAALTKTVLVPMRDDLIARVDNYDAFVCFSSASTAPPIMPPDVDLLSRRFNGKRMLMRSENPATAHIQRHVHDTIMGMDEYDLNGEKIQK